MLAKAAESRTEIKFPEKISEKIYVRGRFLERLDSIGFTLICIALILMVGITVMPDTGVFDVNLAGIGMEQDIENGLYPGRQVSLDILKIPVKLGLGVSALSMLVMIPVLLWKERKDLLNVFLVVVLFK